MLKQLYSKLTENFRGVKAIYYKKEILALRINSTLNTNHQIAIKMFDGFFGRATYSCDELMLCYRYIDTLPSKQEYDRMADALYKLGFRLTIVSSDGKYVAGMAVDDKVQQYLTDRALKLGRFNGFRERNPLNL
jgi:hypothetical protein